MTKNIWDEPKRIASQADPVEHPSHYTTGDIECIEAIKASLDTAEFLGYCQGNAIKYLWRWRYKGGSEDLRKARWYVERMLSTLGDLDD